jgi:DNA-binding GntR family transcriptional regulator
MVDRGVWRRRPLFPYTCLTMLSQITASSDEEPSPLRTRSAPEAVYEALRESIVSIEEPPGAVFTETAIASRYGVARPTAKAALERLVAEGLLTRRAHHSAQIPELSRADIDDLYSNRAILEAEAIRHLALDGVVPVAALALHRELLEHVRSDNRAALARADINFHRELVLGQSSPRLAKMHGLLMGEIELCIGQVQSHQLIRPTDVAAQHQGILDAVADSDSTLAGRLTREHIFNARDRLLQKYDSEATA